MSTTQYSLDQYKTDAQRQLEEKRRNTQQAADINHQKLLKYLPQQTKGYSIGMTETAKIAANNAYQRQLAEADAAYTDGMTELSNYVRQEQERLDDKAKAEQAARYNEIVSAVQNGEYNTTADLERYLGINDSKDGFDEGSIAADLSDFQKANLLNMYQTRASDPEQQEADNNRKAVDAQANNVGETDFVWSHDETDLFGGGNIEAGDNEVGANLEIKNADGKSIDVEYKKIMTGEEETAIKAAYKKKSGQELREGTVFTYDGEVYILNHGELWSLQDRSGNSVFDSVKNQLNTSSAGASVKKTTPKTVVKKTSRMIYYSDGTHKRIG